MTTPKVTREDREAAARWEWRVGDRLPELPAEVRAWIDGADWPTQKYLPHSVVLAALFAAHRLRERERCAKVCEREHEAYDAQSYFEKAQVVQSWRPPSGRSPMPVDLDALRAKDQRRIAELDRELASADDRYRVASRQYAMEREAWAAEKAHLLDPVVRAKMLEPPPPMVLDAVPTMILDAAVKRATEDAFRAGAEAAEKPWREALGRCEESVEAIRAYAHANSTGPAVPDALWEIRAMCDAMDWTPSALPKDPHAG